MTTNKKELSFECFPPKTEQGQVKLQHMMQQLNVYKPQYFSVTYGAGGSTRKHTAATVYQALSQGITAAPHLSFGGDDEESIKNLLHQYQEAGVKHLVALRGDLPSGMGRAQVVYANQLVEFIKQHFGEQFHIAVAAYPEIHPQAKSYDEDIQFLKQKLDAGADSAITQYFYNADAYDYFLTACASQGIDKPIVPGIMPIINFTNLARFSQNCGAEIPRWLSHKLTAYQDDQASLIAFARDYVISLCEKLLALGAPELHFYTMNQYQPTAEIVAALSTHFKEA